MPTTFERERQLQEEIASRVEHDLPGVDVLAVELLTPTRFCVFVDHSDGVDHALCKRVTDVLRDYLRDYGIEVSSPGLDRPLRRQQHFEAARGRRVKVRTAEDGYVVVLRSDAQGRVRVLFPLDPSDDDFVRGGRTLEVRGRGDREAFYIDDGEGSGVVLAARSAAPFKFEEFAKRIGIVLVVIDDQNA